MINFVKMNSIVFLNAIFYFSIRAIQIVHNEKLHAAVFFLWGCVAPAAAPQKEN